MEYSGGNNKKRYCECYVTRNDSIGDIIESEKKKQKMGYSAEGTSPLHSLSHLPPY